MLALDDYSWGSGSAPAITNRVGIHAVETFVTCKGSTPLPIDLGRNAVFYQPTGPVVVFKPLEDVVHSAVRHAASMAVLPISTEDEATVDALVKRRLGTMSVRRLGR